MQAILNQSLVVGIDGLGDQLLRRYATAPVLCDAEVRLDPGQFSSSKHSKTQEVRIYWNDSREGGKERSAPGQGEEIQCVRSQEWLCFFSAVPFFTCWGS